MSRPAPLLALVTLCGLSLFARAAYANCAEAAGQIAAMVIPARVPGRLVQSGQAAVPVGTTSREVVTLEGGTWSLAAVPCPLGRAIEVRLESLGGRALCAGRSSGTPSQALTNTPFGLEVDQDRYPLASTTCEVTGGSYVIVVEMLSGEPGSSTAWQIRR